MSFMDFSMGDGDENVASKAKKYAGETGNTDRVSFVWFHPNDDGSPNRERGPRFTGAKRYYLPGVGYFLAASREHAQFSDKPAKMYIATIIAVWPTNRQGVLDQKSLSSVQVKPWIFPVGKYEDMKIQNREFPFQKHDLNISCKDSQFQKLTFSMCGNSVYDSLCKKDSDSAKQLVARIQAQVEDIASGLQDMIARNLTVAQIQEKISGATGGSFDGGSTVATNVDIDGLLDEVV